MQSAKPRISVLVDLEWSDGAGGHLKFWQRVVEAGAEADLPVDLSVHAQGRPQLVTYGARVRVELLPPGLSTRRLGWLVRPPEHTDLAPFHGALARRLAQADLVHTTDAYFAHARTAERIHALLGTPLVTSLHTDTPAYTRIYAEQALQRLFGSRRLGDLVRGMRIAERLERAQSARLTRHIALADHAFAPGLPRRGVDRRHFSPARSDRERLRKRCGVSAETRLVLCVGRLSAGKRPELAASTIIELTKRGHPVHGLFAGEGPLRAGLARRLGPAATFLGQADATTLGWLYASSDLLLFPSRAEIRPNVVLEARVSGLPAIVALDGGGPLVRDGIDGFIVSGDDPGEWANAAAALLARPQRRAAFSAAAACHAEDHVPGWLEVIEQDLVPVWLAVAEQRSARRGTALHEAPAGQRPDQARLA